MNQETMANKQAEVEAISEKVQKSKSIVLVDYRGLTVAEDTALRVEFRKAGVEYKVLKNSLVLRAFEKNGFSGFDKILEGPTSVAFGLEDVVAPAKIAAGNNKIKIKGGIIEGKAADLNEITTLSRIPAKPVLVAQLLGMLQSPIRSLAVALSEIAKKKEA